MNADVKAYVRENLIRPDQSGHPSHDGWLTDYSEEKKKNTKKGNCDQ